MSEPILSSPYKFSLLDALKGARNFLAKDTIEDIEDKTSYVCYAIADYIKSVGGSYIDSCEATSYIERKLIEFNPEDYTVFTMSHAILFVPELENISCGETEHADLKQKARHLWLDSLIAELENTSTNTDTK